MYPVNVHRLETVNLLNQFNIEALRMQTFEDVIKLRNTDKMRQSVSMVKGTPSSLIAFQA